ncbi:DUF6571 family protein [Streptomyces coeruleoprunus]|uniref:DUF6571 family protein n=1 Tax=Streptomyces coeruleoprunus TaxID=285563 RepID=A0ABV9XKM6_9ACTN
MVTCSELRDLRLGKLGTAVTQWGEMVRKLTLLAEGGDGGPNAADFARRAAAADWQGDNATVTKAFTTTTARQFTDILTEARSIHAVLRDAHTQLAKCQGELRAAIEKWSAKGVRFEGNGAAFSPPRLADNSTPDERPSPEDLNAATSEVRRILADATETDRIAARALRGHAQNKNDFDEKGHRSLKDADLQQGREDAETALGLASKGADMTDADLKRFNTLTEHHRDNAAFAERFATKLGATSTLAFWKSIADPYPGVPKDSARARLLAVTQENLGMTLATATHSASPAMQAWERGVIAAGGTRIGENGPYGFQVMSSLMRKGTWETGFLGTYGRKLIEFERSSPVHGGPRALWNFGRPPHLTYPPGTAASDNDPIAGFMEALGHNPKASLEFFGESTGTGAKDGLRAVGNWDYLVDKGTDNKDARDWPTDRDGKTDGYAGLGHALEAATLGYAYDAENPSVPSAATPEGQSWRDSRTALMERVVDHYQSTGLIDKQDGIRPSLARMAAGHIDSLNYSVDNFAGSGDAAGRDTVFGADRHRLRDFGRFDSAAFLRALASDQDAYETVSAAQQLYGTSAMAAQGADDPAVRDAGLQNVYMHGLLDSARSEAIGKEFADEAERRNLELEKQAAWRGFVTSAVVGAGVGAGTALVTGTGLGAVLIPIAVETVGGAVETHVATQTMDWLKANKFDNSDEANEGLDAAREVGERQAATPLLNWAQDRGLSRTEISEVMDAAEGAYGRGRDLVDTDDRRGH